MYSLLVCLSCPSPKNTVHFIAPPSSGWPCNSLWATECGSDDSSEALSWGLKRPWSFCSHFLAFLRPHVMKPQLLSQGGETWREILLIAATIFQTCEGTILGNPAPGEPTDDWKSSVTPGETSRGNSLLTTDQLTCRIMDTSNGLVKAPNFEVVVM